MKERKSFMLYTDCGSTLKLLTNEEIGEVIRAVFALVQEEEIPEISSRTAEVFFSMLKTTLEREFEKYQAVCERNRENGRRGGRPSGARP